jgi:RNA polymerase sigma factor (sigma-70 family)
MIYHPLVLDVNLMPNEVWLEDEKLIQQCLNGDEAAWVTLISRYKNLIFSVPIKYGLSREEAADIFQSVCLDLLCELNRLREPRALPAWLIRITYNKCYHQRHNMETRVIEGEPSELPCPFQDIPEARVEELEREQALRNGLGLLSQRCQRLLEMLFFESPTRPYQEIAKSLSLATGSIGSIRRRCLTELRRTLEQAGFR